MAVEEAKPGQDADPSPPGGGRPPHTVPQLKPWSAFAFRDYRILWLSSVMAMVTMQMRMLVTAVWLYQETGSGLQLGLLGLIQLAVQLPAILYGGTLADEVDRKKLMAATQSFSFLLIGTITLLLLTDSLRPWHIYGVTAILGVTSVIGGPSRTALTANVVPRTHLMHAITANTATMQMSSVAAPLVFAGAVEFLGIAATFALTTIVALPSTVLPLFIRTPGVPHDRTQGVSVVRRVWEGFLFVKSHPILPGLYILDLGVTIVSFYRQILPLLADRLFRAGAGAVGLLTAANSLGGIAGTLVVLFLARFRPKGMVVLYATLAYAVLLIAFGLGPYLWVGALVIIGLGATDSISMTTRQTTVQLTVPDNMRGRAVSFHSIAAMSANNSGTFYVGFMSEQIGAGNTMVLGGIISIVVVAMIWYFWRGIREYRYP